MVLVVKLLYFIVCELTLVASFTILFLRISKVYSQKSTYFFNRGAQIVRVLRADAFFIVLVVVVRAKFVIVLLIRHCQRTYLQAGYSYTCVS